MMAKCTFTPGELRRFDGERGNPKYVAYEGVVNDVSDWPRRRPALTEDLHFPGQDSTAELHDAPHGPDVFSQPEFGVSAAWLKAAPRS